MNTPFKHPLATHSALDVLGWRRNGSPIYAIAGGSGEGEPGPAGGPPVGDGNQPPPAADPPKPTPPPAAPEPPETDWKAEARKWEKRAKENNSAVTELEQLRQSQMSEHEKAVAEAETRGRTAAASDYGRQLAAARFEAAAATAGVQLGDAAELIDVSRFVTADGQVDTDAIQTAVTRLAAIAPKPGPGRSGADLTGGHGDTPPSVDKQIAEAQANGDWRTVMRLQNSKLPGLAGQSQ